MNSKKRAIITNYILDQLAYITDELKLKLPYMSRVVKLILDELCEPKNAKSLERLLETVDSILRHGKEGGTDDLICELMENFETRLNIFDFDIKKIMKYGMPTVTQKCAAMLSILNLIQLASLYIYDTQSCGDYFLMEKRCDEPYGTDRKTFTGTTLSTCVFRCQQDDDCFSVTYDDVNNTCRTNTGKTTRFLSNCTYQVTYAEVKKSSCKSVLYGDCINDADCTADNSICNSQEKVCECGQGLSYNPANITCVTHCEVYGTSFMRWQHCRLPHSNTEIIKGKTAQQAMEACLNASTYRCLSIDFFRNTGKAYLSKKNAMTRPLANITETDYYHRNCE